MTDQAIKFLDAYGNLWEAGARNPLPVVDLGVPKGATPLAATSGNVANATAAATLAGVAGLETYLQGFSISGAGATSGLPVIATLTGYGGITMSYIYTFVAGVLVPNRELVVHFPKPLKASAVGGSFALSCPAGGTGNTHNCVNIWGYAH